MLPTRAEMLANTARSRCASRRSKCFATSSGPKRVHGKTRRECLWPHVREPLLRVPAAPGRRAGRRRSSRPGAAGPSGRPRPGRRGRCRPRRSRRAALRCSRGSVAASAARSPAWSGEPAAGEDLPERRLRQQLADEFEADAAAGALHQGVAAGREGTQHTCGVRNGDGGETLHARFAAPAGLDQRRRQCASSRAATSSCAPPSRPGRPPLLLIHGYPTASYDWVRVWPRLAASILAVRARPARLRHVAEAARHRLPDRAAGRPVHGAARRRAASTNAARARARLRRHRGAGAARARARGAPAHREHGVPERRVVSRKRTAPGRSRSCSPFRCSGPCSAGPCATAKFAATMLLDRRATCRPRAGTAGPVAADGARWRPPVAWRG